MLTKEIAEEARQILVSSKGKQTNLEEQYDLLTILMGRLLHIVEDTKEMGNEIEAEIAGIVSVVYPTFTSARDEDVREAALDILRNLPLRTENEIMFALAGGNKVNDGQVQKAIAQAFGWANPKTVEAKKALELGKQSPVEVVRKAVEGRLRELEAREKRRMVR